MKPATIASILTAMVALGGWFVALSSPAGADSVVELGLLAPQGSFGIPAPGAHGTVLAPWSLVIVGCVWWIARWGIDAVQQIRVSELIASGKS